MEGTFPGAHGYGLPQVVVSIAPPGAWDKPMKPSATHSNGMGFRAVFCTTTGGHTAKMVALGISRRCRSIDAPLGVCTRPVAKNLSMGIRLPGTQEVCTAAVQNDEYTSYMRIEPSNTYVGGSAMLAGSTEPHKRRGPAKDSTRSPCLLDVISRGNLCGSEGTRVMMR